MIRFARRAAWGLVATVAAAPLLTLAATPTFKEIVEGQLLGIGDQLIYLLYVVAFAVFLFGVFRYFFGSGANAEENRQKGRQLMLWGIISLVVLFAIWGIIRIFLGILESWA